MKRKKVEWKRISARPAENREPEQVRESEPEPVREPEPPLIPNLGSNSKAKRGESNQFYQSHYHAKFHYFEHQNSL